MSLLNRSWHLGRRSLRHLLVWGGWGLALALLLVLALRAWESRRGEPLALWHTVVPPELEGQALAQADWAGYLAAEQRAMAVVQREVVQALPAEQRVAANRYAPDSPVNPLRFERDWNRSYVLEPAGAPRGAVVLLHGLTDSPYSLRHVARAYQAKGWLALAIRLPGHGTVPAGLTEAHWQDWQAATRLALREAVRRVGPERPLHLVGFSNGAALALQQALDALEDETLPRAQRLVLISPMIGVTSLARFAGVLGWPAAFPAFAKAAWLDLLPEFNPFKYNSFPVHAARQSSLLTRELQRQLERLTPRLGELPPILGFQSVLDYTVSTPAVVQGLFARLPANGSELVLFDINHQALLGPLLRPGVQQRAQSLLPAPPRRFRATLISNAGEPGAQVVERVTPAGAQAEQRRALGLSYPADVFSLSHVALPFPPEDGLYGSHPDGRERYGVALGAMAARGERASLIVGLDALLRMSSNPFHSYMMARIDEGL